MRNVKADIPKPVFYSKWTQAVDAQVRLLEFVRSDYGHRYCEYFREGMGEGEGFGITYATWPDASSYQRMMERTISQSPTWWVTPDMCDVIDQAAEYLPEEGFVTIADIISQEGFAVLAKPIYLTDVNGEVCNVQAIMWSCGELSMPIDQGKMRVPGIFLAFFSDVRDENDTSLAAMEDRKSDGFRDFMADLHGNLSLFHALGIPFMSGIREDGHRLVPALVDTRPDEEERITAIEGYGHLADPNLRFYPTPSYEMKWINALWLITNQKIAAVEHPRPIRQSRRQWERQAKRPGWGDFRIIDLRRREQTEEAERNGQPRPWSHRWWVRAHWARRWAKDERGNKYLRSVLIHPYLKGPEELPVVIRDDIFRVRR